MLYTAKGAGALLVPIAAGIAKAHGWGAVFTLAMSFNLLAAFLALVVLKPMRARHFAAGPPAERVSVGGVSGTRTT
jgi:OFA family oxalate/formate antiporter-like MFS transporter